MRPVGRAIAPTATRAGRLSRFGRTRKAGRDYRLKAGGFPYSNARILAGRDCATLRPPKRHAGGCRTGWRVWSRFASICDRVRGGCHPVRGVSLRPQKRAFFALMRCGWYKYTTARLLACFVACFGRFSGRFLFGRVRLYFEA